MKFLLLIYDDEKRWNRIGKPDYGSELEEYRAFGKEFAKSILGGNALQPTTAAKTVRVRNSIPLTTDGPFAETKEQLGGYYLVEASTEDEAVAIAAKIPGGSARLDRGATDPDIFLGFDVDSGVLERRSSRRRLPRTPNSLAEGALP